jgi:hypothetical protein
MRFSRKNIIFKSETQIRRKTIKIFKGNITGRKCKFTPNADCNIVVFKTGIDRKLEVKQAISCLFSEKKRRRHNSYDKQSSRKKNRR